MIYGRILALHASGNGVSLNRLRYDLGRPCALTSANVSTSSLCRIQGARVSIRLCHRCRSRREAPLRLVSFSAPKGSLLVGPPPAPSILSGRVGSNAAGGIPISPKAHPQKGNAPMPTLAKRSQNPSGRRNNGYMHCYEILTYWVPARCGFRAFSFGFVRSSVLSPASGAL